MKIKQIYLDILVRLAPGPIGWGMTAQEVAKELNINVKAVYNKCQQFKKKYPEAWNNFNSIRTVARQDRFKLRWKQRPIQEIGLKLFSELDESITE